jgi:hypothetical protein
LKFNERELEGYKKFIEENLIKITENCLLSIKKHDLKFQHEKNEVEKGLLTFRNFQNGF